MPDFELRVRRARGSELEAPPGVPIIPNVDADARRVQRGVEVADRRVRLDRERRVRSVADNELLALEVRASDKGPANLVLRLVGGMATTLRVYGGDQQDLERLVFGRVGVAGHVEPEIDYALALPKGDRRLDLFIEATELVKRPALAAAAAGKTELPPATVMLQLLHEGVVAATGYVRVAPLRFQTALAPPEAIYICEIGERRGGFENGPTLADVEAAVDRAGGVELRRIPPEACHGDAWAQDQAQLGYFRAGRHVLPAALALPRLRADVAIARPPGNLTHFVTHGLPSRDFGLVDDLIEDRIVHRFIDARAQPPRMTFNESFDLFVALTEVNQTRVDIVETSEAWNLGEPEGELGQTFFTGQRIEEVVRGIGPSHEFVQRGLRDLIAELAAEPGSDDTIRLVRAVADALAARVARFQAQIAFDATGELIEVAQGGGRPDALIPVAEAEALFRRLEGIHNSKNFGGNIEVIPPSEGEASRLLVGTADEMDPALIRLLQAQGHETISIDTSWLDVAHVDEVMTFVPHGSSFALLYSSPELAFQILQAALELHQRGLPPLTGKTREDPELTWNGDHPLTWMFGAQQWEYEEDPPVRPPRSFRQIDRVRATRDRVYAPRVGSYDARISVWELLENVANTRSNEVAYVEHIAPVVESVGALVGPDVQRIPLPVVFDEAMMRGDEPDFTFTPVGALTPNLTNLVVLGDHLLVPRPFGPRMRTPDAVAVVGATAPTAVAAEVSERLVRRHDLTRWFVWNRARNAHRLARSVRERTSLQDHTQEDDALAERIVEGNPEAFSDEHDRSWSAAADGSGHQRWSRVEIEPREPTVDLFELYVTATASALGLTAHFVDSWYYHVRAGEVHCGTNVLRRV